LADLNCNEFRPFEKSCKFVVVFSNVVVVVEIVVVVILVDVVVVVVVVLVVVLVVVVAEQPLSSTSEEPVSRRFLPSLMSTPLLTSCTEKRNTKFRFFVNFSPIVRSNCSGLRS